jgi:DNA-binding transcriptional ArsR family regulator
MRRDERIFQALGDRTRRALFERLTRGEAAVNDLVARFDVSQPAISQHLATLERAGLVEKRKTGRHMFYRAQPAGLAPLLDWVERYQSFWLERLSKLNKVLEEMK